MIRLLISSKHKNLIEIFHNYIDLVFRSKKIILEYKTLYLPIKIRKKTVLKSPHVFKRAKNTFEVRFYRKLFVFSSKFNINVLKYLLQKKPKSIQLKIIF